MTSKRVETKGKIGIYERESIQEGETIATMLKSPGTDLRIQPSKNVIERR